MCIRDRVSTQSTWENNKYQKIYKQIKNLKESELQMSSSSSSSSSSSKKHVQTYYTANQPIMTQIGQPMIHQTQFTQPMVTTTHVSQPMIHTQTHTTHISQPKTIITQPQVGIVTASLSHTNMQVPQSQIISSQIIEGKEQIKKEAIRTEYLPITKYIESYDEQVNSMYVPIYKKIRDLYVIEHQKLRIPEKQYTSYYEYIPEDRQVSNTTYKAVEKTYLNDKPVQNIPANAFIIKDPLTISQLQSQLGISSQQLYMEGHSSHIHQTGQVVHTTGPIVHTTGQMMSGQMMQTGQLMQTGQMVQTTGVKTMTQQLSLIHI
eukprot:TRINITY_DN12_c0_g1_i8.p1 TRINITY_DN12_c0_g1~~TRINITY_DN12_c0_g1_i8.p1  ORF type:complete len:319 (-),score=102.54 TRINITY_DN12_c0_g1_i8:68-1024(-)